MILLRVPLQYTQVYRPFRVCTKLSKIPIINLTKYADQEFLKSCIM